MPSRPGEALTEGEKQALEMVAAAETGGRKLFGWQALLVTLVAVGWCLFQMYSAYVGTIPTINLRSIHLGFGFALAFLVFSFKNRPGRPETRVPWFDWVQGALAVASVLYFLFQYANIANNGGMRADVPMDLWMGSLLVVMLLLATWRTLGISMVLVSVAFILFALMGARGALPFIQTPFHNGSTWPQLVGQLATNTEGIFGTSLGVSAQIVFLFVLFGAVFDKMGAGDWFMNISQSLLGRFRGGAAKASIVSSGLNGMISGSAVANVVTGGNITIGTMMRTGYSREKAGAIEVASSSNGQLMPPAMGAAAFIIAENLQIEFRTLILAAAIPAFLCYAALLVVAHIEALKLNLQGVPRDELPRFKKSFLEGWYYLFPLGYLIGTLTFNHEAVPERVALFTIIGMMLMMLAQELFWGRRDGRGAGQSLIEGGQKIVAAFESGARNMIGIAIATASAGIVVGIVTITGLGYGLADVLEAAAAAFSNPFLRILVTLFIAQLIALILGTGLPTTANYIVMAALIVPIIAKIAGLDTSNPGEMLPVHLFAFYFGIMADSTPPVALAATAAAAISGGDPMKTGVQAFQYEMRTALLAYMMFFNPSLLLIQDGRLGALPWTEAIPIIFFAFLGLVAFGAATLRFLHRRTNPLQMLLLLVAAFILMIPNGVLYDLGALGLIALVYFWQKAGSRREPPAALPTAA
jgi:TRAP transporter 4TM/12TM fusion protein